MPPADRPLPRVKVCGLTRLEDVLRALEAGADALGFVRHAPSPRHVAPEAAAELIAAAGGRARAVAVLVDATPEDAAAFVRFSGADAVQLCGAERARDWGGFDVPVLRRLAVDEGALEELERWASVALGFVLDHPAGPGGTGRAVDARRAAELARRAPCLLAGGLDAANVAERVREVGPAGVDGSSRLEARPGVKDHRAVGAFVAAARAALAQEDARR